VDKNTIRHDTSQRHRDKYANKNIVHQLLLGRFLDAMAEEIRQLDTGDILDFGCGEALFWQQMQERRLEPQNLTGMDLRGDALEHAHSILPQHRFIKQDILSWQPEKPYDLVIASQVLEHLPEPGKFLDKLVSLSCGHVLLSVPWEPFFRLANLARGRDILRLGNHPEHINSWGARTFTQFVEQHARIVRTRQVFPFLIVVCQKDN